MSVAHSTFFASWPELFRGLRLLLQTGLAISLFAHMISPVYGSEWGNTGTSQIVADAVPSVMGSRSPAVARSLRTINKLQLSADDPYTLPNDPYAAKQWSFLSQQVIPGGADLFNARTHNAGVHQVVVAIVDSGVMLEHEDLSTLPGYDFVSNPTVGNDGDGRDADPSDPGDWVSADDHLQNRVNPDCTITDSKWHGTAIAGVVGANGYNQIGITGGAPDVALLPVRITGKCGGSVADLIDGIRWAAGLPVAGVNNNPNPARVINLSVGFAGSCSAPVQRAINDAVAAGSIVVTAATNSGVNLDQKPHSPASCDNVLSIGSSIRTGNLASYSAHGSAVFLLAPGGAADDGIMTSDNPGEEVQLSDSGYGYHFGTSLAAAHVSAALASLLSIQPDLSNQQLTTYLARAATPFSSYHSCRELQCGYGRLNARRAVQMLLDEPVDENTNTLADPIELEQASIPDKAAIGSTDAPGHLLLLLILAISMRSRLHWVSFDWCFTHYS